MKNINHLILFPILIIIIIILAYIGNKQERQNNISSPVEKIDETRIITIVDSVVDSRAIYIYTEEVIDSDDISVPHDSLGRVLLPNE